MKVPLIPSTDRIPTKTLRFLDRVTPKAKDLPQKPLKTVEKKAENASDHTNPTQKP